jgi:hypothetical protein
MAVVRRSDGPASPETGVGLEVIARLEMDRRHFLALAGSVTAAAALAACSPSVVPPSPAAVPTPAPTQPPASPSASAEGVPTGAYGQLRHLRDIVQASPDHLPTLAAAAVATGDPAKIVDFVREHVAVLPGSSANGDAATEVHWGTRGTLASGRGTLRERADLLVELLGLAGVTGRVVTMPRPDGFAFGGQPVASFAPDLGALGALWDAIDPSHPALADAPDDMPLAADRAASEVLAALPPELRAASVIASGLPDRIPAVTFGDAAAARWTTVLGADPLLTQAPAGVLDASDAVTPRVSVSVDIAVNPPSGSTIDRAILHEVLRAEWAADEVAARNLTLAFGVPGSGAEMLGRSLAGAPVRMPVLRLEATDAVGETVQIVGGKAISVAGGLLEGPDGPAGILTGPVGDVLTDPSLAARASGVSAVEARVNASTFPTIELALSALDATGAPVDGLPARAFEVTEDGLAQPVTLIGNRAPAETRVLVIYDGSGSVTDFWSTAKARAAFDSALATSLVAAAAAHPFTVQVITLGDLAHADAWTAPDAASLASTFTSLISSSDIWATLAHAIPASAASAAILVSDNVTTDLPADVPALRRLVRAAGTPVAVLPMGKADEATTKAILADTGGQRFDPRAAGLADKLTNFISARVASAASTGYRLRYVAPADGPQTRSVTVTIPGAPADRATVTYEVPAEAERSVPSGIAGVYLTVRVGDREMRRRLGGLRVSDRGDPGNTADALAIGEATGALDAIHTIRFDPGATTAHLLSDLIDAALTFEPVEAAWADGPAAIAAAATGWRRFPAMLAALSEPVGGALVAGAAPAGLAVKVLTEAATETGLVQLSDVVPTVGAWLGAGPDPEAAFRAAARGSLAGSIREASVFPESAAAGLDGRALTVVPALTPIDSIDALTEPRRAALAPLAAEYASFHRLVPTAGDLVAAWLVDPATGSLTAVGADGRGAGKDYSKCLTPQDSSELQSFISTSVAMISMLCIATPDVVSTYACVGSDVYGAATAAFGSFTAPADISGAVFNAASYAAGLAAANIGGMAGRSIIAVLLMIAGMVAGGSCV